MRAGMRGLRERMRATAPDVSAAEMLVPQLFGNSSPCLPISGPRSPGADTATYGCRWVPFHGLSDGPIAPTARTPGHDAGSSAPVCGVSRISCARPPRRRHGGSRTRPHSGRWAHGEFIIISELAPLRNVDDLGAMVGGEANTRRQGLEKVVLVTKLQRVVDGRGLLRLGGDTHVTGVAPALASDQGGHPRAVTCLSLVEICTTVGLSVGAVAALEHGTREFRERRVHPGIEDRNRDTPTPGLRPDIPFDAPSREPPLSRARMWRRSCQPCPASQPAAPLRRPTEGELPQIKRLPHSSSRGPKRHRCRSTECHVRRRAGARAWPIAP